jgi:hypothetical protein
MWPLAMAGCAGGQNPAGPVVLPAVQGRGEEGELTYGPWMLEV